MYPSIPRTFIGRSVFMANRFFSGTLTHIVQKPRIVPGDGTIASQGGGTLPWTSFKGESRPTKSYVDILQETPTNK